ncbi:MAG TPA: hypothetical protein VIO38_16750, partial [Rariglobus sp.]
RCVMTVPTPADVAARRIRVIDAMLTRHVTARTQAHRDGRLLAIDGHTDIIDQLLAARSAITKEARP